MKTKIKSTRGGRRPGAGRPKGNPGRPTYIRLPLEARKTLEEMASERGTTISQVVIEMLNELV